MTVSCRVMLSPEELMEPFGVETGNSVPGWRDYAAFVFGHGGYARR